MECKALAMNGLPFAHNECMRFFVLRIREYAKVLYHIFYDDSKSKFRIWNIYVFCWETLTLELFWYMGLPPIFACFALCKRISISDWTKRRKMLTIIIISTMINQIIQVAESRNINVITMDSNAISRYSWRSQIHLKWQLESWKHIYAWYN